MNEDISEDSFQFDHPIRKHLKLNRFIFCPGCLIGSVITSIAKTMVEKGLASKDYAIVSGIGCTGRTSGCFNSPAFHTTHGRAIPFATGLKLANPKLKVIVLSGDGDLFAIGGNHFIHGARRNIELTVICVNNSIYGMTGGQIAPTSMLGDISATTPYGNIEPPFNLVSLAAASGATYVARWPAYDTLRMEKSISKAIDNEGFSFIETIVPCEQQYGSKNRIGNNIEMLNWIEGMVKIRTNCPPEQAEFDFKKKIIVCGEFVEIERDGFSQKVTQIRNNLKKKKKK